MSQRSKTPPADRSQKNLHVCNLPPVASDEDVREIFAQYGEVTSAMVVRDLHTGKSTRTAFVSFAHPENAAAAREALHKRRLSGERWQHYQNKLSVQWAKKEHDAVPVGDARVEMRELFVRNVPLDVTEADVCHVACAHGNVMRVRLCEDTRVNLADPRRIAFILFEERGAADAALRALHDRCPFPSCCGVPLMCKLKEEKAKPAVPRARDVALVTTPVCAPGGDGAVVPPFWLATPLSGSAACSPCDAALLSSRGSGASCGTAGDAGMSVSCAALTPLTRCASAGDAVVGEEKPWGYAHDPYSFDAAVKYYYH